MSEPVAGKYLLEILTKGMYSNPLHVFREYIQNSSDSIDEAIRKGICTADEAIIHIEINPKTRSVIIRDNGIGISVLRAESILLSIGASNKNGIIERGFRGIGRLAGLAYAEEVRFISSVSGEEVKTVMVCDCNRMQKLLLKTNQETTDVMETFRAISIITPEPEEKDAHYFEVQLINVHPESGLLDEERVIRYLSETAPVDFNSQLFPQARRIKEYFSEQDIPLTCYKIFNGKRKLPIFKQYSRSLSTGQQARSKTTDIVRDIEFVFEKASDGKPLYIGWVAITDFSGSISDESIQGIRLRKGNILVGNNTTFAKFFPTTEREGQNANKMFAGEIHILHDGLLPNSQRDDFEPGKLYDELKESLGKWAGTLNKKYRRGTSEATSALKKLNALNQEQQEIEEKVAGGSITSDERREQLAEQLERITRQRAPLEKKVRRALEQGTFDPDRQYTVEKTLSDTESATKKATQLNTRIVNAGYATKNDLPSSYGRDVRRVYQRIIRVIDMYFSSSPEIAEDLRKKIIEELNTKKK